MARAKQYEDWQPGVSGRNLRLSLDRGYLRATGSVETDESRPLGRHETSPDYTMHVPIYLMDPYQDNMPDTAATTTQEQGES